MWPNHSAKVMNEVASAFGQFLLAIQQANIDSRWLTVQCYESDQPEKAEVPERRLVLENMQGISLQALTSLSGKDYLLMLKKYELVREKNPGYWSANVENEQHAEGQHHGHVKFQKGGKSRAGIWGRRHTCVGPACRRNRTS